MRHMSSWSTHAGGRIVVTALHCARAPSDVEWDEYLAVLERALVDCGDGGLRLAGLTITDGGAPNAGQRRRVATIFADRRMRSAAVSRDPDVHRVAQAWAWLNPNHRAFVPSEFAMALDYLWLDAEQARRIWSEVVRAKLGMAAVHTLSAIAPPPGPELKFASGPGRRSPSTGTARSKYPS